MQSKLFWGAMFLVVSLIGLSAAEQGAPRGPGRDNNAADEPPPPPPPPPGMRGPGPLMVALDTDKDGKLSAAEIANASKALAGLDKNQNGEVDTDELRPQPPKDQKGQQGGHILRLDTNKDGVISLEEFSAPAKEVFSHIDANHDGKIDADEAAAAPPPPPQGRPMHGRPRGGAGEGPQGGPRQGRPHDGGGDDGNGGPPPRESRRRGGPGR